MWETLLSKQRWAYRVTDLLTVALAMTVDISFRCLGSSENSSEVKGKMVV